MYPTAEKDRPLREDIRLLGRLLGDTLREQEGEARFTLIENIRRTAVRFHRDQDPGAKRELEAILARLDHEAAISVVRAFNFFLQLANIAEDLHHNRRRAHQMAGSEPQGGQRCACARAGARGWRHSRRGRRLFRAHARHAGMVASDRRRWRITSFPIPRRRVTSSKSCCC